VTARVGIIGGGQLGAYLSRAASALGFKTTILAKTRDDVAVPSADRVLYGSSTNRDLLLRLAIDCDFITFEHEDVAEEALDYLRSVALEHDAVIAPDVPTMRLLQNKAHQKQWLADQEFPTAEFSAFDRGLSGVNLDDRFGARFVIKSQRGGYDGLGVTVVRDGKVPAQFETAPCIVETLVEHKREIAVLVARNSAGDCLTYPPFATEFDEGGNVLRQVVCPAGIDGDIERAALDLALEVGNRLRSVGVFAIEMFLSGQRLLINEIAPRVHNVGHLTIEANQTSQFEQHIRAVTGMPLAPVAPLHEAAVMSNLLFEPRIEKAWQAQLKANVKMQQMTMEPQKDVHVHWYGKSQPRHLRKMGHVTAVGADPGLAAHKADQCIHAMQAL
jgi:5-(carboxyamino)imidazole ribonucleotide synthase